MSQKKRNEYGEIIMERKGLSRTNKPVELPDNQTWLKNANVITKISADYTVLQLKLLVSIVEQLQEPLEKIIVGYKVDQLNLFENNTVTLEIPYQYLEIPANKYADVRKVAKDMAAIPVEFDAKNPKTGEPSTCVTGLCKFYFPKKYGRCFTVVMEREVANMFLMMEQGIGFTKFMKEIAFKSSSKYTFRIYWLISSWKKKGGFSIYLTKFRSILSLENKYKNYHDLYKRVIRPVYEELFEKADVWFEVSEVYRCSTDSEPYKLNFKVIKGIVSEEEKQKLERNKKIWSDFCTLHFGFTASDKAKFERIFTMDNYEKLQLKIEFLYKKVMKDGNNITNINKYCLKALMKEVGAIEDEYGNYVCVQ